MWLFHSSVSSVFCPALLTFFFYFEIFIYLFGLPDTLTFRDHYRVLHWMTDWPEETQRWGGKKCINRKTPPASTGQRSQGRTFSALLTFLPVKAKCWGAADIFFLPSVAAAFILFIFLPPTPQLSGLLFQALRNGIGCVTIEKNIHMIFSPVCRIPFSEMLHV